MSSDRFSDSRRTTSKPKPRRANGRAVDSGRRRRSQQVTAPTARSVGRHTMRLVQPAWKPGGRSKLGTYRRNPQYMSRSNTGWTSGGSCSHRQLVALTTFSDLLVEVKELIQADAAAAGLADDGMRLRDGGRGVAYADAVVTYLAFAIDKCADTEIQRSVRWEPVAQCPRQYSVGRQFQWSGTFAEAIRFRLRPQFRVLLGCALADFWVC